MIKDLDEFIKEFQKIVDKGPIKSHRKDATGIGKTLEDLLGIEENNNQAPDFGEYELKSHRKNVNSMITLITKSPDIKKANAELLKQYGYIGESGKKELHISLQYGVWTYTKDKKHKLSIDIDDKYLYVIADDNVKTPSYWSHDAIRKAVKKKYAFNKMVHALANAEKKEDGEYFSYVEAFSAEGISGDKLIQAIKNGYIIVDIRIGTYADGSTHDHGTGFRIKQQNQFDFYEHIKDLVGSYCKELENKKNKK